MAKGGFHTILKIWVYSSSLIPGMYNFRILKMDLFRLLTLFFLSHGDVYCTAVPTSHVTAKPNWQTHTRPTNPTESTYCPYQRTAAVFAEN